MKKILALILALVMVLCLSACSDGYSGNTTNNTNSGNSINGNQGNNQNSSQDNQNNQSSNQSNNQNSNHIHNYAKNVIAVATCTTNGVESFTCSCGDFYTETVNATGHTPVKVPAVSATCTTEGKTEGSHCGTCGAVIVAQEVAPMTGHNYVSGTCSVCSVTLTLQDASNTYLYLTNSIQFSQETVNGYLAFSCAIFLAASAASRSSVTRFKWISLAILIASPKRSVMI